MIDTPIIMKPPDQVVARLTCYKDFKLIWGDAIDGDNSIGLNLVAVPMAKSPGRVWMSVRPVKRVLPGWYTPAHKSAIMALVNIKKEEMNRREKAGVRILKGREVVTNK